MLTRRGRRRRSLLVAVVGGALAVSAAGLGAATLIKSPRQLAAEAGPPEASVISAAVERRVLKETVVLRGTVAPGKTISVTPSASGEGRSVVTRTTVREGQRVKAGMVVAEVSGRPVIALRGPIPAYRDIRPDAEGPDVKQVQAALRGLGYAVSDDAGEFGASTRRAVKRLYDDRGYAPPTVAAPPSEEGGRKKKGDGGPKVFLKAGEVVFVPDFPARVAEVKAGLGAEVTDAVLSLAAGDLRVRGSLAPADRRLVRPGLPVKIFHEETGASADGRVVSVGGFSGSGSEPGHPTVVEGRRRPLPERFAGQDVRLTVEAASTREPVLAVPSSAIYATAAGTTQVVELGRDGAQRPVAVRTGATGAGFVEVRSRDLAEGDRVVVGK